MTIYVEVFPAFALFPFNSCNLKDYNLGLVTYP